MPHHYITVLLLSLCREHCTVNVAGEQHQPTLQYSITWRKTTLYDIKMMYCKERYMKYSPISSLMGSTCLPATKFKDMNLYLYVQLHLHVQLSSKRTIGIAIDDLMCNSSHIYSFLQPTLVFRLCHQIMSMKFCVAITQLPCYNYMRASQYSMAICIIANVTCMVYVPSV